MNKCTGQKIIHVLNEQKPVQPDADEGYDWFLNLPDRPKVLAIIPARGGSKGLARKNAKLLCGKPLVAYSIEAALKSRLVDRVVVSTDDDEIADIARSYSPDIALRRPDALGGDRAIVGHVVEHARAQVIAQGFVPSYTITLYPTHPFRTPSLINRLTSIGLVEGRNVMTVREVNVNKNPHYAMVGDRQVKIGDGGEGKWFRPRGNYAGAHAGPDTRVYLHVLKNEIELIDIDYLEDFMFAEEVIKQGLFNFDEC